MVRDDPGNDAARGLDERGGASKKPDSHKSDKRGLDSKVAVMSSPVYAIL